MNCIDKAILFTVVYIKTQSKKSSGNALLPKYKSTARVIEELKQLVTDHESDIRF